MQNVVELCLHLDENCRKHRERKKSREFWGLHFQKLTAYDWWMADTRGKSITGFQLLFTIGIGLILKEIKYWFITLQEAVPFYLGEVCVGGGGGYRVWGPPYHRFPEFRFSLPWHSNFLLIMNTTRQEMFNLNLKWGLL